MRYIKCLIQQKFVVERGGVGIFLGAGGGGA